MRTIVRRLGRNFGDPGSVVSIVIGAVGALSGGNYESRAPTHTVPARESNSRDRRDKLSLAHEPTPFARAMRGKLESR